MRNGVLLPRGPGGVVVLALHSMAVFVKMWTLIFVSPALAMCGAHASGGIGFFSLFVARARNGVGWEGPLLTRT